MSGKKSGRFAARANWLDNLPQLGEEKQVKKGNSGRPH
jgi:hypothetical protein